MNRRPNNQQGSSGGNNSGERAGNNNNRNRRRRGGGGGTGSGPGSGGGNKIQAHGGRGGERQAKQQEGQQGSPQIEAVTRKAPPVLKRYGVVFYDNHAQAREDIANLQVKSKEVDQLNIVIRAEGTMDDPELLKFGKVFAGEAWHLIHQRRMIDDKWYNEPHE